MKKNFCLILSICLIVLSVPQIIYAQNAELSTDESYAESCQLTIESIEIMLSHENSTVQDELESFCVVLQNRLRSSYDVDEAIKINNLINQTQRNIVYYEQYKEFKEETSQSVGAQRGVYDPTYTAAVLAIIAYFNHNGYLLSAELLTHALENNNYMSNYYPVYGERIIASSVFNQIISTGNTTGTGAFDQSSNTILMDLYYGIHNFSYNIIETYSGHIFCLYDPYDYEKGSLYTGIAQAAINTMYGAQMLDVIVPFMTRVEIEY